MPEDRRAPRPRTALLLLALLLSTAACDRVGYRALEPRPNAGLSTRGAGISARIERIHVGYWQTSANMRVDVHVVNEGKTPIHIEPERIEVALLGTDGKAPLKRPDPESIVSGDPVGDVVVAGAKAGSAVGGAGSPGGPGGSGSVAGGAVGATVGLAAAAVVLFPLAIYAIVDAAVQKGEKDLDPGEGGTYRLTLPRAPIESGAPYVLRLHPAVHAPADAIEPLPLVNPGKPHLGYGPPADSTWVFVARIGGGVIHREPVAAGLGGFEIFTGPQFGRFSFGLSAMIGAGSIGGEVRYRFDPTKALAIVPFAGYGWYPIAGIVGLNAGHGGRVGAELQVALGEVTRFGWARSGGRMGIFANAGPVYVRVLDSVGFAAQGGLTFGFF
ncbi:hypothetical protein [Polyangium sp. y55x31]|uniref:hypothetical protein n=1 Tax=Polyangium sp. y55x31 TaxID=3042688 RepID=UPI002482E907|nr:hypothetical protein [Polyangium sp. y55x31]